MGVSIAKYTPNYYKLVEEMQHLTLHSTVLFGQTTVLRYHISSYCTF